MFLRPVLVGFPVGLLVHRSGLDRNTRISHNPRCADPIDELFHDYRIMLGSGGTRPGADLVVRLVEIGKFDKTALSTMFVDAPHQRFFDLMLLVSNQFPRLGARNSTREHAFSPHSGW